MRRVKKTVRMLIAMLLICMMLPTIVSAADTGSVWLNVMQTSTGDGTDAVIATDTTVTDGLVELEYDSSILTYGGIQVNEDYVAKYAVNADQAGVVKIGWVAPGAYETGDAVWLVKVSFSGAGDVALSGKMNDADGNGVTQGANLDTTGLEKAILEAEGLYEGDYTPKSYAALKSALEDAKAVLADPAATQSEVDAAAEALNAAIDALELKKFTNNAELYKAILRAQGLCPDKYTAESYAAVKEASTNAKAVMAKPGATQKQVDDATKALNDAMDALELKQTVNTAALQEAVAKAEALNENDYTKESYAAVKEALKDAKAVLADPDAAQAEVDQAADALNSAMDALEEKPAEDSGSSIVDKIREFFKGFFSWFN